MRLLVGELRQGALEGVLVEAVARAAKVPADTVRRAAMMAGNLGEVATQAMTGGLDALVAFQVQVLRPLDPMLADSAPSVEEALERLGRATFEWKIDGARIQVHKAGAIVRVFTRNLRDVTAASPKSSASWQQRLRSGLSSMEKSSRSGMTELRILSRPPCGDSAGVSTWTSCSTRFH